MTIGERRRGQFFLGVKHTGRFGDTEGQLRISRTFGLKNRILVRGSEASAEISVHDPK